MFSKFLKKKNIFTQELSSRLLSMSLENGWVEDKNIPDPITFTKESNAKGALQVSVVTFEGERKPTIDELTEVSNLPQNLKEYKIREWNVYEFDEENNEFYRKNYYLIKTHVFVYISYYGTPESKRSSEIDDVKKIVNSITVISKN